MSISLQLMHHCCGGITFACFCLASGWRGAVCSVDQRVGMGGSARAWGRMCGPPCPPAMVPLASTEMHTDGIRLLLMTPSRDAGGSAGPAHCSPCHIPAHQVSWCAWSLLERCLQAVWVLSLSVSHVWGQEHPCRFCSCCFFCSSIVSVLVCATPRRPRRDEG